MRIAAVALLGRGDADALEYLDGRSPGVGPVHALVDPEHLGYLFADADHRVQRRQRVLEDHGDLAAPDALVILLGQTDELLTEEFDRAAGDPGRRGVQDAHDGLSRDRFARPRLAQDRDGLAPVQRETHTVDGSSHSVAGVELDLEVIDFEQQIGHTSLPQLGVEGVTDCLAQKDEGENGDGEHARWHEQGPRRLEERVLCGGDHGSP